MLEYQLMRLQCDLFPVSCVQASFQSCVTAAEASVCKGQQKWSRTLPEHSTASFAMLLLVHSAGWPNHLLWEQWLSAHPQGYACLFTHMKVCV